MVIASGFRFSYGFFMPFIVPAVLSLIGMVILFKIIGHWINKL